MPTLDQATLITDIQTILTGKVGNYNFPDGTITEAFAFLPDFNFGYNYPPSEVDVDGIECVVLSPNLLAEERQHKSSWISARWQVFLKQWDLTKDITDATETLILGLNTRNYRYDNWVNIPASESLGIIRSISLEILDNYILFDSQDI